MEMLKDKIDKLEYAKKAVLYCLDMEVWKWKMT